MEDAWSAEPEKGRSFREDMGGVLAPSLSPIKVSMAGPRTHYLGRRGSRAACRGAQPRAAAAGGLPGGWGAAEGQGPLWPWGSPFRQGSPHGSSSLRSTLSSPVPSSKACCLFTVPPAALFLVPWLSQLTPGPFSGQHSVPGVQHGVDVQTPWRAAVGVTTSAGNVAVTGALGGWGGTPGCLG